MLLDSGQPGQFVSAMLNVLQCVGEPMRDQNSHVDDHAPKAKELATTSTMNALLRIQTLKHFVGPACSQYWRQCQCR